MYNTKNISTMEPHNKVLHLAKLQFWAENTLLSNLIESIESILQQWPSGTGEWQETYTYHWNVYEEELIRRGHVDKVPS